jgi:hypothetical protein
MFDQGLVQLVRKMINLNEEERPKLKEILSHPSIARHGKKTSLKNFGHHRDPRMGPGTIK